MIQQKEIRAFTKFNGMMEARIVSILNSFIGLKIHFRCDLILETRAFKLSDISPFSVLGLERLYR